MSAENGADVNTRVADRAQGRCEYCRMHQSLQGATFHVEHIIPRSAGGSDSLDNFALACPGCNLKKSNRVSAVDPETGQSVPFFHPRQDQWSEHFDWAGQHVVPKTAVGRATLAALDLNHPRRILVRQAEAKFGLFPPAR
jgi:HNH endonuclease